MAKAPNPKEVVVGLDVGRSGVKLAFYFGGEVKFHFIPSVVMPAKTITYDTNPKITKENTVELNGKSYFVGQTAIEQGALHTVGLNSNWLEGFEHQALLQRCKTFLKGYGVFPRLIVVGLPCETFLQFQEVLFEQVDKVFNCSVLPVPQPWGVYQDRLLNDDGKLRITNATASQEKVAVIDVGHFTTDIMLMNNRSWIQESTGSTIGMSKSCEELKTNFSNEEGINISLIEAQEVMRTRKVKVYGEMKDASSLVDKATLVATTQIEQYAKNLLGSQARTIDHILLAGGGGASLFNELKKNWPQTILVEDPRNAVVGGMRKFGLNQAEIDPDILQQV